MNRDSIPRGLAREVLIEAGHRCAIPTCLQVPVELAHIEPWSKVKEHTFDNIIALCPTCHTRYDRGDIDRLSMRQYKANLSILNSRYGDLEKRVLKYFADNPDKNSLSIFGGLDLLLSNLLRDRLIVESGVKDGVGMSSSKGDDVIWSHVEFLITEHGRAFIQKWMGAQTIE